MKRARVIPVLLFKRAGLIKTVNFKDEKYVGDPINAIRIFNEKEVDELIVVDILATEEQREPHYSVIEEWASECFMPLCYGGGITGVHEAERLLHSGIEKFAINAAAAARPELIREAARAFGSQSVVVSVDVKDGGLGRGRVVTHRGSRVVSHDVVEYVRRVEDLGAGEILLNSVERDGTMKGYDLGLIAKVSNSVNIPVVALGGAGSVKDFQQALSAGASAVAAGSMFVFHGKHRAVLITYPEADVLAELAIAEEGA